MPANAWGGFCPQRKVQSSLEVSNSSQRPQGRPTNTKISLWPAVTASTSGMCPKDEADPCVPALAARRTQLPATYSRLHNGYTATTTTETDHKPTLASEQTVQSTVASLRALHTQRNDGEVVRGALAGAPLGPARVVLPVPVVQAAVVPAVVASGENAVVNTRRTQRNAHARIAHREREGERERARGGSMSETEGLPQRQEDKGAPRSGSRSGDSGGRKEGRRSKRVFHMRGDTRSCKFLASGISFTQ